MAASFNVEHFRDAAGHNPDWTPDGRLGWTERDMQRKAENLAEVIRWLNAGRGPEILGLNEVGSQRCLDMLCEDHLADLGYRTVLHTGSDATFGNGLISRFPLVGEPIVHHLAHSDQSLWDGMPCRVLEATLSVHGRPLTVFVNHWPSRNGGAVALAQRRDAARQVRTLVEARLALHPNRPVMVLGDFNANPSEPVMGADFLGGSGSVAEVRAPHGARLFNTVAAMAPYHVPQGREIDPSDLSSIDRLADESGAEFSTHQRPATGEYTRFDQILLSGNLLGGGTLSLVPGSPQIGKPEAMLNSDGSPKRTLLDRSAGLLDRNAYSDHLPVVTRLVLG